jgi:hypothetical protein
LIITAGTAARASPTMGDGRHLKVEASEVECIGAVLVWGLMGRREGGTLREGFGSALEPLRRTRASILVQGEMKNEMGHVIGSRSWGGKLVRSEPQGKTLTLVSSRVFGLR